MKLDLTLTFLELGDATSRNLEFSHCDDVWVSYGEETITETNLLEIRRRHPEHVRVRTFPKQVEATNGADWEWHIVGLRRTLSMRVQAKRLQRNGVLKVKHTVKSSGKEQRDLLIDEAGAEGMKPVYCIYCTEPQRGVWTQDKALPGFGSLQTGCLLADATHVPGTRTKLGAIEDKCRPWHHLFARAVMMREESEDFAVDGEELVRFVSIRQRAVGLVADDALAERVEGSGWNAPTIEDLNGDTEREFDWTGVRETTEEDLARLEPDTMEILSRLPRSCRASRVTERRYDAMVPSASRWVATATLTSLLSRLETPTPANVLALPCKHRHGRDARSYLALDAEQIRVHLATVEDPVEKAPLVLRQLEEERESFPAQLHGLCDPRVDIARIAEQIAGQADGEIAAKLA